MTLLRGVPIAWVALGMFGCSDHVTTTRAAPAQLGALLFAETGLSNPVGEACAECHSTRVAFRDPDSDHSTSKGAVAGRFGSRNTPSIMYARFIPPLHRDAASGEWIGGLFLDGRANTLQDQLTIPLRDPLEMNNLSKADVVARVAAAPYAQLMRDLDGAHVFDDVEVAFGDIVDAVVAYERSTALSPFSSKYDHYLAGTAALSPAAMRGLAIFEDPKRGACALCHPNRPSSDGQPPLFTTYGYANLGIPIYRNSLYFVQAAQFNPLGEHFIDHGLMNTVHDPTQDGKFRIPTLRNVARTGPYGHNGYFENLPYMIDFLNTRDGASADPAVKPWAPPEVPATVDRVHVGHLGLSQAETDDLVAFLNTLTDDAI